MLANFEEPWLAADNSLKLVHLLDILKQGRNIYNKYILYQKKFYKYLFKVSRKLCCMQNNSILLQKVKAKTNNIVAILNFTLKSDGQKKNFEEPSTLRITIKKTNFYRLNSFCASRNMEMLHLLKRAPASSDACKSFQTSVWRVKLSIKS